ncbi:tetratricopeptide repeat protein [Carboxylicivirga sp. M1479]|uniref:tetratricopeptide repeat protein n=1 Tax=Carboxylicivirga sp. M1479 TaxID=2594476 RepID=UPI001177EBAF|nr:tetratricopeptide repeat protein [Carboxylicivirga sp. M1479]TRX64583.1 hypothetical protein FNN09_17575 [Carboxylicivirga sp. M1479]
MKKTDFFDLVAQPHLLNEDTLPALNEIVAEFPWFQTARMLLIKNLHCVEHVKYNGELKQSATYIADRKRLFELINQSTVPKQEEQANKVDSKEESDHIREVESQIKEQKTSSVGMTTKVSSIEDYFQTADTFETSDGDQIDFSLPPKEQKNQEETSSIVMPSADFLGYESAEIVGYELKEAIDPEETKDESHSFSDWLNMMRHTSSSTTKQPVKKKSQQIIDNFLQIDVPKIVNKPGETKSSTSLQTKKEIKTDTTDDLMSETLADIYIKQKHYDKAISIYEKLSLKYPEKNVYFARRISDLEKLTN